ncbi:MAG: hypothetical protein K0Q51_364 [Rickettsiaceae bacterium]|jgi:hypothetical protein|nr:hypothetical protein [Rickettsiaceae bacterium]
MRKVFFYLLISIGTIIAGGVGSYTLIKNIDLNEYFFDNRDVGHIEYQIKDIVFTPTPNIIIENINIGSYFYASQAKLFISVPSLLLTLKPRISHIELSNCKLNTNIKEYGFENKKDLFEYLFSLKTTFQKIILNNFDIDGLFGGVDKPRLNRVTINKEDNKYFISALTEANNNITLSVENEPDNISLKLGDQALVLNLFKESVSKGRISLEINDFRQLLENYFLENTSNSYIFNQSARLLLTGDLTDSGAEFTLNNLKVESNIVEKIEGQINLNNANLLEGKVELKLGAVNLSEIVKFKEFNILNHIPKNNFLFSSKGKFNFSVKAEDIILPNAQKLANLDINGNVANKAIEIKNFSTDIAPNGHLELSGKINQDRFRPIFEGVLRVNDVLVKQEGADITPQSMNLVANFAATEKELSMSSIKANINEVNLEGNAAIKFIASTPKIQTNLTVKNFDFNNSSFAPIKETLDYLNALIADMKQEDYAQKIASYKSSTNYGYWGLDFTNSKVGNVVIDNIYLNASILPNNINVTNLKIIKNDEKLVLKGQIQHTNVVPEINLNILSGMIRLSSFEDVQQKIHRFLASYYDPEKLNLNIKAKDIKLETGDYTFENLSFNLLTQSKHLNSYFSCNLFEGTLTGTAKALFTPFKASVAYALNNFQVNKTNLPKTLIKNGVASFSVSSTIGDNLKETISKGTFIAKEIDIQNLAVDDFVLQITLPNYDITKLEADGQKFFNQGTTNIDAIKGEFQATTKTLTLSDVTFKSNFSSGALSLLYDRENELTKIASKFSFYPVRDNANKEVNPISFSLDIEGQKEALSKKYNFEQIKQFYQTKN